MMKVYRLKRSIILLFNYVNNCATRTSRIFCSYTVLAYYIICRKYIFHLNIYYCIYYCTQCISAIALHARYRASTGLEIESIES